jgi:dolichol-phosphate mannosyltransferase
MNIDKQLDIIVPCFNEEKNLDIFTQKLLETIKKINIKYKIIFVDDGSKDTTWNKISNLSKDNKNILGIKLSRNFGHQAALKAGIDFAQGDYVFSLDADLQDPPELLLSMINKMRNDNLNIVYAQRRKNNENFLKKIFSYLFYYFFNKICKINILNQVSDFRLIDKKVLTQLKLINENNLFYRGLIPWIGFNYGIILFERPTRLHGETGWSVSKMVDFALIGIFNFSTLPMKLSFFICLVMIFVFIIFFIYAFYSFLINDVVRGWTSLALIISFFNIMIFFILGLISEYVGRIYHEVKKRPNYIINETTE